MNTHMLIDVSRSRNNVERAVSDNYLMIRTFKETCEGL